jgi:thioredoxin reductase (NADPH)
MRKQAETYGITVSSAMVTELKREGLGFVASWGGREVKARFVLLATGIIDESPDLPGLKQAIDDGSIRYCPVCDGYEATDQRIGILGHGGDASSKAKFLRTYSNDVTLLSLDDQSTNEQVAKTLRKTGIKIAGPVSAIEHSEDGIRAVLQSGKGSHSTFCIRR